MSSFKLPIYLLIFLAVISNPALHEVDAMATTTYMPTTHIVSYVHLAKAKKKSKAKNDEFPDFVFENIRGNLRGAQSSENPSRGGKLQMNERLVQQPNTNLDNSLKGSPVFQKTEQKSDALNSKISNNNSDDSTDTRQNTLENSKDVFGATNNHHESPRRMQLLANGSMDTMWNRNKQSIPVLEPVKHLVNSVRNGALNHTFHNRNHHHQLLSPNTGMEHMSAQNESSAIETEEEREMVNESTEFKLLEVLGTLGGLIWSFFTNIQKVFAASSGSASAASSSSSSGGNR